MALWNTYQEFSPSFLAQHHDYVLYDTFHHIQAFLLYPLNCGCKDNCICEGSRAKVVLSLNVDLYNKTLEKRENPELLHTMKLLLEIPDDSFFREHYAETYPLWLINDKLHQKETDNHFRIVARLVWTLLRIAATNEASIYREPRASLNEAIEMILGKTPLKTKAKALKKEPYLCGEKGYSAHFNAYKSVCHFMASYQFLKEEKLFSFDKPSQIQEFLSLSHWIREKLLSLQTPNIKAKSLFSEEVLCPLPPWVESDKVGIALQPYEDKLE